MKTSPDRSRPANSPSLLSLAGHSAPDRTRNSQELNLYCFMSIHAVKGVWNSDFGIVISKCFPYYPEAYLVLYSWVSGMWQRKARCYPLPGREGLTLLLFWEWSSLNSKYLISSWANGCYWQSLMTSGYVGNILLPSHPHTQLGQESMRAKPSQAKKAPQPKWCPSLPFLNRWPICRGRSTSGFEFETWSEWLVV